MKLGEGRVATAAKITSSGSSSLARGKRLSVDGGCYAWKELPQDALSHTRFQS